uniref:suppressor of kinetochore protein 1-like n=1 Tax=Erigeron canadensis TaxID=72917 RepID=UPI001CB97348|nr:suppressor of kinetochore protein 1-like [Erigeron canadensis]
MPRKSKKACSSKVVEGAMIRLMSSYDKKIVRFDPACCFESEYIQRKLAETEISEREGPFEIEEGHIGRVFTIIDVRSNILSMVKDFCVSRFNIFNAHAHGDRHLLLDKLLDFSVKFVHKKPLVLLVLLMDAAYKLRIGSLLNLTRNRIVDMLRGKSAEEILKTMNLPDFTHEAWEKPSRMTPSLEAWHHERMIC